MSSMRRSILRARVRWMNSPEADRYISSLKPDSRDRIRTSRQVRRDALRRRKAAMKRVAELRKKATDA